MTGVTHDKGTVIINFGKPVIWIGFPPWQAIEFAKVIIKHAEEVIEGKKNAT
jgi:hypothetical protein